MPDGFSSYLDNKVIDHVLGPGSFTKPSRFVALFIGDPTAGGTELSTSGTGYARQPGTFSVTGGTATNNAAIEFGPATTAWGTINYVAIYDASTSGNMMISSILAVPKTVAIGDVLRFSASTLTVTVN